MKSIAEELNGAWEEPGVLGTRIEIGGRKLTVLWRNAPVLETTFRLGKGSEGRELILKKRGLRYPDAGADYAEITGLRYLDGTLTLTEHVPITGESRTAMKKTEHSRYGNYSVENEILKELRGTWKSGDGFRTLAFRGDEMSLGDFRTRVCVLRSRDPYAPPGRYLIADRDPSVFGWQGFDRFVYEGGVIRGQMMICDARPAVVEFTKQD